MPTALRESDISWRDLLLDPNNLRFHDLEGFVQAAPNRFHEESVQRRTFNRLKDEVPALKKSIIANGYIRIEKIIVRPYEHQAGKFLVIEGNRRLAAIKWIQDDIEAGVTISPATTASIAELPCVVAEEAEPDPLFRACLMGIRHVSGIDDWGGYQRAKLVTLMRDELGRSAQEVSDSLGMTVHEVNRRYRAFKALQQMKDNEDFGEYATPQLYPHFHEAVSLPTVRDWLGWDDDTFLFTKDADLLQFYQLLCPQPGEDDDQKPDAKLKSREQVRQLADILPKAEARRILLDPARSFAEAIAIASHDQLARAWASAVADAIAALEAIGVADLKRFTAADIDILRRLSDKALERIRDYEQLIPR